MDEIRSNIKTLLTSDTTYLIPPGVDETEWYLDCIMGQFTHAFDKVNRFEIVDHRPCDACTGAASILCGKCGGGKVRGRTVLAQGNIKVHAELQDNDETLKVFVERRHE